MNNGEYVTCEVKGLSDLQAKLEEIPKFVARKGIRKSLALGGSIMRYALWMMAPRDTGFLAEHFDVKLRQMRGDIYAGSAFIGPQGKMDYPDKDGSYREKMNKKGKIRKVGRISVASVARFLEFGTRKMAKKPFMSQAFESYKQATADAIINSLRASLNEAVKNTKA